MFLDNKTLILKNTKGNIDTSVSGNIGEKASGCESLLCNSLPFFIKILPEITKKNSTLTGLETEWIYHQKTRRIIEKIQGCEKMPWARAVCKSCGEIVSDERHKLTCGLRYCANPLCVGNRIKKNILRLESANVFSSRLIHFEISFPYVANLHKEFKNYFEKVQRTFFREMKKLGTPVNALRIFDLKEKDGKYFYHFHFAQMPVKDYMLFVKNVRRARAITQLRENMPLVVHFEGWRPKKSLFGYFAKRMAGVYGDETRGNVQYLADFISADDYANNFYNVRTYSIIGDFPRPRRGNVLNVSPVSVKECPYCHSHSIRLVPEEMILDPPPRTCKKCGLQVWPRDYNFELELCKFCAEQETAEGKMKKRQEQFNNFQEEADDKKVDIPGLPEKSEKC